MNHQFLHSQGDGPALRIGIISCNQTIPAFARQILEDIAASDFAHTVCVIDCCDKSSPNKPFHWIKTLVATLGDSSKRHCLFYKAYQTLIEPLHPISPDPLEKVPFDDLIDSENIIRTTIGISRSTLQADKSGAIRPPPDIDVLLDFSTLKPDAIHPIKARDGIWFYRLGEGHRLTNDTNLIASVLEDPASTARIMLEREESSSRPPTILAEAYFSLTPNLSARHNRFPPYWGTTHFVIEKLRELHQSGQARSIADEPAITDAPALASPTNQQVISYQRQRIARTLSRLPTAIRKGQFSLHWQIAIRQSATPLLNEQDEKAALKQFKWLQSPPNHFWADPFLLEYEGSTWLFFEDFDILQEKGKIACGRIDDNGDLIEVQTVLERDYHLSFPLVFRHQGKIYMVPESAHHQRVDLFYARHFPEDWVLEKQLLDVSVVDATLYQHAGRWWMLASPMAVPGHTPMTCLWTAEQLTGEWALAPAGTISNDVHYSRNGGSIFTWEDSHYRISQDCSRGYGTALWFNKILQWDARTYKEQPCRRIDGHTIPGLLGIHSYNRTGNLEVIDGKFLHPGR